MKKLSDILIIVTITNLEDWYKYFLDLFLNVKNLLSKKLVLPLKIKENTKATR